MLGDFSIILDNYGFSTAGFHLDSLWECYDLWSSMIINHERYPQGVIIGEKCKHLIIDTLQPWNFTLISGCSDRENAENYPTMIRRNSWSVERLPGGREDDPKEQPQKRQRSKGLVHQSCSCWVWNHSIYIYTYICVCIYLYQSAETGEMDQGRPIPKVLQGGELSLENCKNLVLDEAPPGGPRLCRWGEPLATAPGLATRMARQIAC